MACGGSVEPGWLLLLERWASGTAPQTLRSTETLTRATLVDDGPQRLVTAL
jgi:hypothetical protein